MSFAHHSLCGSVIEHQNTESKGLRFDCLWELTRLQDYISMTVFLLNCFFQKTLNIPSYQFLAALPCTSHRLYSLCSLFWCGCGSKWLICYDVTETHSQDPKCVFYLLNKESRVILKNKSLKTCQSAHNQQLANSPHDSQPLGSLDILHCSRDCGQNVIVESYVVLIHFNSVQCMQS